MIKNQEIEDRILNAVHSLPPNQRKVADFFLENMNVVALSPIKDIAQKAQVSEAAIVRFAQALGYRGYKELRDELSATLKNQISPTERFQQATSEKSKTPDTLKLVARFVIGNINDTVKSLDPRVFSEVIDCIINARQIHCLGLELSYYLALLMTFQLRLYTYDARHLSLDLLRYQEQIATLTPADLLIAFSFSPYSRETVEASAFARQRDIPVLAFTDKKTAPIQEYATYCIQIKTDGILFSNSVGAIAVVINAIITELNFRDKERTLSALKLIEDSIKDERYFITK